MLKYLLTCLIFFLPCAKGENSISDASCPRWPTKEYSKIRSMIENGNNDQAIQTINKAFSGLFPYRIPVTNGYPMAFFYYDALADAYMNQTNYVDAIDTYRQALLYVSDTIITQHPVAYAKSLHTLGKTFFRLRRFTDAESLFLSASKLVHSDELQSDIYFTRCLESAYVLDWETAAENAEKCIDINPDYNTEAFHYLAAKQYSLRQYEAAIETWLTGLYGIPLDNIEDYLDICLQYFRNMNEKQIVSYYEALTFLASRSPCISSPAGARLLQERIKLQKLYPNLFEEDNPADIIYTGDTIFDTYDEATEMLWTANKQPVLSIDYSLLQTNTWERKINTAIAMRLYRKNDYKAPARARDMLEEMINHHEKELAQQKYAINGWSLLFFTHYYRVIIEKHAYYKKTKTKTQKLRSLEECRKMIEKGTAGRGGLNELFAINSYAQDMFFEKNMYEEGIKAMKSNESLFPKSYFKHVRKHFEILMSNEPPEENANLFDYFDQMCSKAVKVPSHYPSSDIYMKWIKHLRRVDDHVYKGTNAPDRSRMYIDICFDGLENTIAYSKPQGKLFKSSNRYKNYSFPLLEELQNYEKKGVFTTDDYNRLKEFLYYFGVSVPADSINAQLIKDIIKWRRELDSILRDYDVILNVVCNAEPWGDDTQKILLWTDVDNDVIEMTNVDEPYKWKASVIVPKDMHVVRFEFYKNKEAMPESPEKTQNRHVIIANHDEDNVIMIEKTVHRDTSATITFYCDADASKYDTDKTLCIIGNIPQLGAWKIQNIIHMSDDGKTYGDKVADDKIFTYTTVIPDNIRTFKYFYLEKNDKEEPAYSRGDHYREYTIPDEYKGEHFIKNRYRTKI